MWWGWLTALIKGIVGPLLQWLQTYEQGRNAEQAKSAQEAAKQSAEIADAQTRVVPIVVDDAWLMHGSNPPKKTPTEPSAGDTPRPRG